MFTPSEAAAIGAFLTLITAIVSMGWKQIRLSRALTSAVNASAMIFLILVAALIFVRFVALTQIPNHVGNFIESLEMTPLMVLIVILIIYLFLGCVLDAIGMVALTIPIVYPIIELLGISGIWFGILLVKVVEIGLITPPIGINVFVVKGTAGDVVSTRQLFVGIFPFLIADLITLAILVAFPELTMYIPNRMK